MNDPAGLHFSAEAQDLFDTWRGQLEARLRDASMSTTPAFESHMSKYRSLMPSLALIFHLVELVDGQTESTEVSLKAAQLACAWCDYLELHARRIYAAETNTGVIAAHALMEKIDDGAINDGMTVRDIYRAGWEGLSDRSIVQAALTVLEQHHAVRVVEHQTGGRSSAIVRLHPSLRRAAG